MLDSSIVRIKPSSSRIIKINKTYYNKIIEIAHRNEDIGIIEEPEEVVRFLVDFYEHFDEAMNAYMQARIDVDIDVSDDNA